MFGGSSFGGASSSTFGQNNTQNKFGAFGNSTPAFGQPQQQSSFGGGGFGAASSGNAFGNTPNNNTSAFGGNNTNAFGATQNQNSFGGGGAFGAAKPAFGGTTGFQQPQNSFGAFGNNNTQQTNNAFGSNTGFGANSSTNAVGGTGGVPFKPQTSDEIAVAPYSERDKFQTITVMPEYSNWSLEELRAQDYAQNRKAPSAAAAGSSFGAFGQTQNNTFGNTGTSSFGNTANTGFGNNNTGNAFGSSNTGFGASNTTNAFGSNQTNNAFGANNTQTTNTFAQPANNAFGNTNTTTNAFGANNNTGAFGQTQPSTFGNTNAFGQTQQSNAFGQNNTTTNAFGAQNTTTNAFGAKPAAGFGSFGATSATNNAFGQPAQPAATTGAFGQPAQPGATTGAFGQPAANPSPFGSFGATNTAATTTTPAFGAFGTNNATAATPAFGSSTTTPAFGSTDNKPANPFGAATTGTTGTGLGAFGSTTPAVGGLGAFGSTPTFGQSATTTTPAAPATNAFGAGAFGSWGKPAATTTTAPATGIFGASTTTPATAPAAATTGSLFGSFGAKPAAAAAPAFPALGASTFGASTATSANNQVAKFAGLNDSNAYGNGALFSSINTTTGTVTAAPANTPLKKQVGLSLSNAVRTPSRLYDSPRRKLRGFGEASVGPGSWAEEMSPAQALRHSSSISSLNTVQFLSSSITSRSSPVKESPITNRLNPTTKTADFSPRSDKRLDLFNCPRSGSVKLLTLDRDAKGVKVDRKDLFAPPSQENRLVNVGTPEQREFFARSPRIIWSDAPVPQTRSETPPGESRSEVVKTTQEYGLTKSDPPRTGDQPESQVADGQYYSSPTRVELEEMSSADLRNVKNFVVGRKGYGKVQYTVPVDLSSLPNLEWIYGTVIKFTPKLVTIYPKSTRPKPPRGTELNHPAIITLEKCWVMDKTTGEPIKDENHPRGITHVRRLHKMKGMDFIDYNFQTGTWVFRVDEFAMDGDDEE